MKTQHNAYEQARAIDDMFNNLLTTYPPTKRNAKHWLLFCRTLRTSIAIVENAANEKLPHICPECGRVKP